MSTSGLEHYWNSRVDLSKRQVLFLILAEHVPRPGSSSHIDDEYARILVYPTVLEDQDKADGKTLFNGRTGTTADSFIYIVHCNKCRHYLNPSVGYDRHMDPEIWVSSAQAGMFSLSDFSRVFITFGSSGESKVMMLLQEFNPVQHIAYFVILGPIMSCSGFSRRPITHFLKQ